MSSMPVQGTHSRPDPAQKFKDLDTDSNGGLDKTELSAMAKELSKMTGKTLNVDDSITTYDADNDGLLNQDEVGTMLQKTLGPPPDSETSFEMQQALQAYQANSEDDDQMSVLLNMLNQSSSSSATSGLSLDPAQMFSELDSDGSGGINKTELDVMAKNISSVTGRTMDTEKAINAYDIDQNGELSQTEMDTMMKESTEKSGGSQQASKSQEREDFLRQLMEQYTKNVAAENDESFEVNI